MRAASRPAVVQLPSREAGNIATSHTLLEQHIAVVLMARSEARPSKPTIYIFEVDEADTASERFQQGQEITTNSLALNVDRSSKTLAKTGAQER